MDMDTHLVVIYRLSFIDFKRLHSSLKREFRSLDYISEDCIGDFTQISAGCGNSVPLEPGHGVRIAMVVVVERVEVVVQDVLVIVVIRKWNPELPSRRNRR